MAVIALGPGSDRVLKTHHAVVVVAVERDVDLVTAQELTVALSRGLDAARAVLVDLCACRSIDSTGLSALLAAARSARDRGVRLAVAAAPGSAPRALFDLVLGHSLFATCDDRASGLAALA